MAETFASSINLTVLETFNPSPNPVSQSTIRGDFVTLVILLDSSTTSESVVNERSREYSKAGADAIFIEALQSEEEFREFGKKMDIPLLANMTEFGKSPLIPFRELFSMGYKIVIFPLTAFRASLKNLEETYSMLFKNGTQRGFINKLMTRQEFYDIIGYSGYQEEDRKFLKGD